LEKVSVIVTIKNNPIFLKSCLESVIKSTYKNIEMIVVNSFHKDIEEDIIADFEEEIKHIYLPGANSAEIKNTGLFESKGSYITFLDSYDINGKMRIELETKKLEQEENLGAVFCGTTYINENSEFLKGIGKIDNFNKSEFLGRMYEKNLIESISTVLFRIEIFSKIGKFDANLSFLDEYDMYLRILQNYDIDYLNLPLVRKRIIKEKKELKDLKIIEKEEEILLKKHNLKDIYRNISNIYKNEDDRRISMSNILLRIGMNEVALENLEKVMFKKGISKNFKNIRKKVLSELNNNGIKSLLEVTNLYNSELNR